MEEKKDQTTKKTDKVISTEVSLQKLSDKFAMKQKLVLLLKQQALGYLKPGDIVNQQGQPYIVESGCQMIAKGFDISIVDMKGPFETRIKHQDGPEEIIFEYQAIAKAPHLGEIEVTGNCSTRDKFLGTKGGEPKALKDIDIPAIMKKACTNLRGTAVRKFLGLSNTTWPELEKWAGIKESMVNGVKYGGKSGIEKKELTDNDKTRLQDIKKWTAEIFEGDKGKAKDYYIELTAFDNYAGQQDPNRWSTKQIKVIYPKIEKRYKEFTADRDQIPEEDIDKVDMDNPPYEEKK